ncbi:MAG TPA: polysaccharide deacetylase family protein [Herpetosiphonaceae bacterium]|nr:polysaccharide deacetylase family protein [Herpetosiphonaceae bacterium]
MEAPSVWPNRTHCAVSLTYDDALIVHYTTVGPELVRHGLRGTFYVPVLSDLQVHPEHWRALSAAGHALGNHTVFHPCRRDPPERFAWLAPAYDLCAYSPAQLRNELAVADLVLRLIDGKTQRTFGNTCCDTTIGTGADEQPIDTILAERFVAARGAMTNQLAVPDGRLNLMNVGCFGVDGWSLAELTGLVDHAAAMGGWAVLMIHGVGVGTHDMYLDSEVHRQFIALLAERRTTTWVAPFIEVAGYLRAQPADVVVPPRA